MSAPVTNFDAVVPAASQAMLRWMLETAADATERLDAGRPGTDRGETRQSIGTDGPTLNGSVLEGQVQATSRHALYVHDGRRPGGKMPPIDRLQPWVERKLGVGPDRSRSVAFLVGRKIKRRGITGNPFLRDAIDANAPRLAPAVAEAVRRALSTAIPSQTI